MFRNLFKKKEPQAVEIKKEPPAKQKMSRQVTQPVIHFHDLQMPEFDLKPSFDADGTPLTWIKRPGSEVGHFAQQLIDDGIAVDFTPYAWAAIQSGFVPRELKPEYTRILATANYYLWGSQQFGNVLESIGAMTCMGASLFWQTQVKNLGKRYVPKGDEGLLLDFNVDDGSSAFGQLDGRDTVILMLPDDAHLFQLFDALGRELPEPTFPPDAGLSLDKL